MTVPAGQYMRLGVEADTLVNSVCGEFAFFRCLHNPGCKLTNGAFANDVTTGAGKREYVILQHRFRGHASDDYVILNSTNIKISKK